VTDQVAGFDDRSGQRGCDCLLLPHETAANGKQAARAVAEFTRKIRQHFVEVTFLEPDVGARIVICDCLDFAFVHRKRKHLDRVLTPFDLRDGR
jgi:hypothetical protein